jgi:hypothetical protein
MTTMTRRKMTGSATMRPNETRPKGNDATALMSIASTVAGACRPAGTEGDATVTTPVEPPLVETGDVKQPAVYLLVCETAGRIKVGYSRHVHTRLRQLGDGCPYPAYPLAIVHAPNYKELEAKMHEDLADRRAHLEWYELTADEAMSYLMDNGYLDGGDLSKLAERHCQRCGKPMTGHTAKRYCSNACRQAAKRVRDRAVTSDIGERYTTVTMTPGAAVTGWCDFCGAEFQMTRPTRRYCNANCRRAAFYQRNPDKAEAKAAARREELRRRIEARGGVWRGDAS